MILTGDRYGVWAAANLAVSQHAGTPGMNVDVAAGRCMILGTSTSFQGAYHLSNDAVVTLTIATAPGSNQRIDLICASIQDAAYAGATNTGLLQVITGTPGSSPAVPATPASSIVLAHVFVGTSVSSILNANVNGTTGTNNPDTIGFVPLRCSGMLGVGTTSGGTITSTVPPGGLCAGMTANVNTPAGHNIRIRFTITHTNSAAVYATGVVYRDGTGGTLLTMSYSQLLTSAGAHSIMVGEAIDQPGAGVHSYGLYCYSNAANNMAFTSGAGSFTVEDLGPI